MNRRLVAAISGAVLVVAIVAGVAVAVGGGDDSPSDGGARDWAPSSVEVTSALTAALVREQGELLPISAPPDAYRITYRIESAGRQDVYARTEVVSIRRPFDAEVVAHTGESTGGPVEIVARSNLGLYADVTDPDDPDVGEGIPAAALGDLRFDGALDDLVGAGLLVPRERRTLLGRECQVYRTGRVVESLQLATPTDRTYADVCIDAAGLVLEQVAFVDGRAIQYEIATAIEGSPQFEPDTFTIEGEPLGVAAGGVELEPLALDEPPTARHWSPSDGTAGEHVARYLLRVAPEPDAEQGAEGEDAPDTTLGPQFGDGAVESYVDVYVAGSSFVVVQQGPSASMPTRDTSLGVDVDAGRLGTARVAFGVTGHTLVAATDTWFVEINAPLSAADLGALASTFAPASS